MSGGSGDRRDRVIARDRKSKNFTAKLYRGFARNERGLKPFTTEVTEEHRGEQDAVIGNRTLLPRICADVRGLKPFTTEVTEEHRGGWIAVIGENWGFTADLRGMSAD